MVATSKLDFFRGSWIADYADAENYLALFYSEFCPNGPNYTHFSNPTYDTYAIGSKRNKLEKRRNYYHLMDQMILIRLLLFLYITIK